MIKKFRLSTLVFSISFGIIYALSLVSKPDPNVTIIDYVSNSPEAAKMPLVLDTDPKTCNFPCGIPVPDRSERVRNYLAASVQLYSRGISGSGTIVYYDDKTQEAYIASCGHIWAHLANNSDNVPSTSNLRTCKVIIWYKNNTKLAKPKGYDGTVLFWSNGSGIDISLVKFKPDWIPEYFPIAPSNYPLTPGKVFHSTGCDAAQEVAHYSVKIVGYRGDNLITRENSPRPGRSGGGLMSDDGFYVGICWGTSNTDGTGIGLFTPLRSMHTKYREEGYGWLLDIGGYTAKLIPVIDMKTKQLIKNDIETPGPNKISIPK